MTHSYRRQLRWSFGLLIVAILLANESITRGHVFDAEGRPLAGADVLLADSNGVYAIGRSDDRGYFRFAHRPFGRLRKSLLICANRNTVHVSSQATSAIIRSSYTIGAEESRFPTTPADLGWPAEAPPSCPRKPVPHDP